MTSYGFTNASKGKNNLALTLTATTIVCEAGDHFKLVGSAGGVAQAFTLPTIASTEAGDQVSFGVKTIFHAGDTAVITCPDGALIDGILVSDPTSAENIIAAAETTVTMIAGSVVGSLNIFTRAGDGWHYQGYSTDIEPTFA